MSGLPKARVHDRISELPDATLCDILSLLNDTKAAARTCILSTRWKNIWPNISNLSFSHHSFRSKSSFNTTVDRVLSLRELGADIKKFRLCPHDISHVDGWIQTAIRHNVVELDLRMENGIDMFVFPESIFTCKTLKVLKLFLHSDFSTTNIPTSGCFPSLKRLYFDAYEPDPDSTEKLFTQCPVLEHLSISGYVPNTDFLNFNISAPELKRLKVWLGKDVQYDDDDAYSFDLPYDFFISAPKLEYLSVEEDVLSNYSFENSSSLTNVHITLDKHQANAVDRKRFGNNSRKLLTGISSTKFLFLSAHLLQASSVPALDNLKKLKLKFCDCNKWTLLFELLNKSPNLERLILVYDNSHCYGDEDNRWGKRAWKQTKSVPICLLSHLKSIFIDEFRGRKDEIEAAKYLLKNGKVLEKMKIYTSSSWSEEKKKDILKEVTGGSKTGQVSVTLIVYPAYNGNPGDLVHSDSSMKEDAQSSFNFSNRQGIHPPPTFGSSPNLEALSLLASRNHVDEGDSAMIERNTLCFYAYA